MTKIPLIFCAIIFTNSCELAVNGESLALSHEYVVKD